MRQSPGQHERKLVPGQFGVRLRRRLGLENGHAPVGSGNALGISSQSLNHGREEASTPAHNPPVFNNGVAALISGVLQPQVNVIELHDDADRRA